MVCSNGNNVLSGLNLCQSLHLHGCIELYYQTYLKHISQKRERALHPPKLVDCGILTGLSCLPLDLFSTSHIQPHSCTVLFYSKYWAYICIHTPKNGGNFGFSIFPKDTSTHRPEMQVIKSQALLQVDERTFSWATTIPANNVLFISFLFAPVGFVMER